MYKKTLVWVILSVLPFVSAFGQMDSTKFYQLKSNFYHHIYNEKNHNIDSFVNLCCTPSDTLKYTTYKKYLQLNYYTAIGNYSKVIPLVLYLDSVVEQHKFPNYFLFEYTRLKHSTSYFNENQNLSQYILETIRKMAMQFPDNKYYNAVYTWLSYSTGDRKTRDIETLKTSIRYFEEIGDTFSLDHVMLPIIREQFKIGNNDSAYAIIQHMDAQPINFGIWAGIQESKAKYFENIGDTAKAQAILEEAVETLRHTHLTIKQLTMMGFLTNLYRRQGEYEKQIPILKEILERSRESYNQVYLNYAYEMLYRTYKKLGQDDKLLQLVLNQKKDNAFFKSVINLPNQKIMYRHINSEIKQREVLEERNKLLTQSSRKSRVIFYLIIGIMILIAIVLISYERIRRKKREHELKEELAKREKEDLNRQLELQNRELSMHAISSVKQSELLASIEKHFEGLIPDLSIKDRPKLIQSIQQLASYKTEDSWKEFELRFTKVHSSFYVNLRKKHPDLTPGQLKICALIRLNLNSKEIANILFTSLATVHTNRKRLRTKLGLTNTDTNLYDYLSSF